MRLIDDNSFIAKFSKLVVYLLALACAPSKTVGTHRSPLWSLEFEVPLSSAAFRSQFVLCPRGTFIVLSFLYHKNNCMYPLKVARPILGKFGTKFETEM